MEVDDTDAVLRDIVNVYEFYTSRGPSTRNFSSNSFYLSLREPTYNFGKSMPLDICKDFLLRFHQRIYFVLMLLVSAAYSNVNIHRQTYFPFPPMLRSVTRKGWKRSINHR